MSWYWGDDRVFTDHKDHLLSVCLTHVCSAASCGSPLSHLSFSNGIHDAGLWTLLAVIL
jgi:hypothetical protein